MRHHSFFPNALLSGPVDEFFLPANSAASSMTATVVLPGSFFFSKSGANFPIGNRREKRNNPGSESLDRPGRPPLGITFGKVQRWNAPADPPPSQMRATCSKGPPGGVARESLSSHRTRGAPAQPF